MCRPVGALPSVTWHDQGFIEGLPVGAALIDMGFGGLPMPGQAVDGLETSESRDCHHAGGEVPTTH